MSSMRVAPCACSSDRVSHRHEERLGFPGQDRLELRRLEIAQIVICYPNLLWGDLDRGTAVVKHRFLNSRPVSLAFCFGDERIDSGTKKRRVGNFILKIVGFGSGGTVVGLCQRV